MRVIITGSKGMLGSFLTQLLKNKGISVIEADLPKYNIISYNSIKKIYNPDKPIDFLINCAAYTDVVKSETERKTAYYVNAQASGILSRFCTDINAHLIHFSTDFVFDGLKGTPYLETDLTNPLNYYGKSKLEGEVIIRKNIKKHTIFRLQWLFGNNNKTFFNRILEKSKTEKEIKIVTDEVGAPCSINFVSDVIYKFITIGDMTLSSGETYHLTHNNFCSRFDSAHYFLEKVKWEGNLIKAKTSDFPSTVERPKFGVLNNSKLSSLLKMDLGTWEDDVDKYLRELKLC